MDTQTVIICYYDGNDNKVMVCRDMTDEQMGEKVTSMQEVGDQINHVIRVPNKTPIHSWSNNGDGAEWEYFDGI